jgi:hypothetical protein
MYKNNNKNTLPYFQYHFCFIMFDKIIILQFQLIIP